MLSVSQLYFPLTCYQLGSRVGLIPFTVDWKNATIKKQSSKKLVRMWWFWLGLCAVRGFLGTILLVMAVLKPNAINIEDIPIAMFIPYCGALYFYSFHRAFVRYGDVTVAVFNKLCEGSNKRKPLKDMTLQECLVVGNPFNFAVVGSILFLHVYFKPYAAFSLYMLFPPIWQNGWTMAAILAFEFLYFLSTSAMLILVVHIMLLFFQKCIEDMRANMRIVAKAKLIRGRRCFLTLSKAIRNMRHLQLLIQTYNQGYCYIHFCSKIFSLATFIICTAAGILLLGTSTQFAAECILLGIDSAILYCVAFQRAFSIPMIIKTYNKKIKFMLMTCVENVATRRIMCGQLRSIPSVGIKVGNFHTYERVSTPNFIAFGSKNIVRAVIALRNQ